MTAVSTPAYDALLSELREIENLRSVERLLAWDQETKMPAKGSASRAEQLQLMSGLVHERSSSDKLGDQISACEADASVSGDPVAAANIREIRRDYDKATKLPRDLVEELAKTSSLGMEAWKHARADDDYKKFQPWMEKTIELNRRKAECFGIPETGDELYDALLDQYEPGMSAAKTKAIFDPLREALVPLISMAAESSDQPDPNAIRQEFPLETQRDFCTWVCAAAGFEGEAGRMDDATHPFCEGVAAGDVRITNRYRPDGWAESVFTALHEGGHATYEQGLPKVDNWGTPLGEAVSLGIHESQSRTWENMVGRSLPFWNWALPKAREMFGDLTDVDAEAIWRAVNIVKPGFIRVESDEVTYNLHIMLRFDLERAMVRGDLSCADLPGVWNERMKSDLGLTVPKDSLGCLQDIHWSMSAVGYFPTYTFGNLHAAQMWHAMAKDIPNRDDLIGRGELMPLLDWYRAKVHQHGRRYSANDLIREISGEDLNSQYLVDYLTAKIKRVYRL